ncbi:hypothetical protein NUSPORA_01503 [Nucleospora cyclopteri]
MLTRKEQIFAATKNVGGKRRTVVNKKSEQISVKSILETQFKGEAHGTILQSCAYKSGDSCYTIEDPTIKSISKNKKNICFVVQGKKREETMREDINEEIINN